MRWLEASALALSTFLVVDDGTTVRGQRYAMGTMFDIVVEHPSREAAERAIDGALDEVERLDRVLSHFKADSDLSELNRRGRAGYVDVSPDLYDVVRQSIDVSRAAHGAFDVTMAPLVALWSAARNEGRAPSPEEVSAARRCVGYEQIELAPPHRIRFRSDCLAIELGGIGKGYAVDRAIALLRAAGVTDAVVNGGSSSITAIGRDRGQHGWPVLLGPGGTGEELLLRDASISTSRQDGAIIDPRTAAPARFTESVTVTAPTATLADALSTALVIVAKDEGARVLQRFPGASAVYHSDAR
jgi:thiamine biosynthesis lipoprotein